MISFLKRSWAIALACTLLAGAHANAVSFDFSNITDSQITFDGAGHFSFPNSSLNPQFDIRESTPGVGTPLLGAFGRITEPAGGFTISGPLGGTTAAVTGTGLFEIVDSTGGIFKGNLTFVNIG